MTRTTENDETGGVPARAPRVFISYAWEDDGGVHAEHVRALWILLRQHGIDAQLDRPAAERPQDWAVWMQREVEEADYVLTIASPAYKRRAESAENPGVGEGVAWEARLIRDFVYRHPADWHERILQVLLPGGSREDLPAFLGGHTVTHYTVDPIDLTGAEKLLRLLTDQPYETEPALGSVPHLPPREDAQSPTPATDSTPTRYRFTGPTAVQIGDHSQQTNNFGSSG
ncbi:toll/interleukin-1 receptor domain-containing protein [Streptomyces pratensis]